MNTWHRSLGVLIIERDSLGFENMLGLVDSKEEAREVNPEPSALCSLCAGRQDETSLPEIPPNMET